MWLKNQTTEAVKLDEKGCSWKRQHMDLKKEGKNRGILGNETGSDAIKVSFMSAQLELHK